MDTYLKCNECGEQSLLDSGPLGLNCFSVSCMEKSKAIAKGWVADWNRREAARLLALADDFDK